MWGTQTPKKGLMHCDKGAGILNLVRPDSHEDKVYDEPYAGKKGVFNSVAYIHYDRGLLREEGVAESRVKVNHQC
jgi:hypothetical protein